MPLLEEIQKETFERIEQFLSIVAEIDLKPYSFNRDFKAVFNSETGFIDIIDDEGDIINGFVTVKDFYTWYIKLIVKDAYHGGQSNLRNAVKELLGLTV